jgi:hypothetical protein
MGAPGMGQGAVGAGVSVGSSGRAPIAPAGGAARRTIDPAAMPARKNVRALRINRGTT